MSPVIDRRLLDAASEAARASPRKRRNHNFHASEADPCNRLLNAIEPGSYVPPHRHADPAKAEAMIVLRGRLGLVFFDAAGGIAGTALLVPGGEAVGVDIPVGTFHTCLALAPGTVFFEAKAGPYAPLTAAEKAPWAPPEGDPQAVAYLARLVALFEPA